MEALTQFPENGVCGKFWGELAENLTFKEPRACVLSVSDVAIWHFLILRLIGSSAHLGARAWGQRACRSVFCDV
jgi:hypothetical protein